MPKKTEEITFTKKEILKALENTYGVSFEGHDVHWEIVQTGDVDHGTYKRDVKSLTLEINHPVTE